MKAKLNIRKINGIDALKMLLFDAWWRPLQQLHCLLKKKKKKTQTKETGLPRCRKGRAAPPEHPSCPPAPVLCLGC